MRNRRWLKSGSAAFFVLLAGGCTAVLGIDKDYHLDGEGGSGGTGGEAGSGGTGGGACTTVADCAVAEPECRTALACNAGECAFQDAPDGTELSAQMPGCGLIVCDGKGGTRIESKGSIPCYTGPDGTQGTGLCTGGIQQCDAQGNPVGGCEGEVVPAAEDCDPLSQDEDCNGVAEESGASCFCGDGKISNDETCDDSNMDPTDACTSVCQPAACGDGIQQPATGEQCDDGGTLDGDSCSSTCQDQKVLELVSGYGHTCARLSNGGVKCWGRNPLGQLGLGDTLARGDDPNEMGANLPFVSLGTGKTAAALAAGEQYTCAILTDQTLKCWGDNSNGQLGLGNTLNPGMSPNQMGDNLPAVDLGAGKTAVMVAAGYSHTCAILGGGSVKCWGYNYFGQLGLGDTQNRGDGPNEMGDNLPVVNLGTGKTAIMLSAQFGSTCALLNDGSVKCWGSNGAGQLGLGDTQDRGDGPNEMGDNLPAVNLGTGKTATKIASGWGHTCAILNDGSVKCWGTGNHGELGLGDANWHGDNPGEMGDNLPAVQLGAGAVAAAIGSRYFFTCAALLGGAVKCWGANDYGQLGQGDLLQRGDGPNEMGDNLPPVDLGPGQSGLAVTTGYFYACARLLSFGVKCWGRSESGQLGQGDTLNRGDEPGEMGALLPNVKLFSDVW